MHEWRVSTGGKSSFGRDMFLRSLTEHEELIFQLAMTAETEMGMKAVEIAGKKFDALPDSTKEELIPYLDISIRKTEG